LIFQGIIVKNGDKYRLSHRYEKEFKATLDKYLATNDPQAYELAMVESYAKFIYPEDFSEQEIRVLAPIVLAQFCKEASA